MWIGQRNRRNLNEIVHSVLIVGLVTCVTLLMVGLILGFVEQRPIPDTTIPLGEAIRRALILRPSGFLSLGLLVLMLTPLLRVIGSMLVFIYERDWRFVGITALVLIVMTISILIGHAG